ncbi:hypothetical protein [Bacillus sp. REN10]|uniref:hypothetical protein n=1 Tax=Bacillus sp. REN10 TaxID=2782541 RepID=UPI00193C6C3A|nr:hypothetical protein [Bacillus sp. REN10]
MWTIFRICEGIYGVSAEPNVHDAWTATLITKAYDNQLDILAEIHMSYLSEMEEYERLLDEIRYFAKAMKREQKKELCAMSFHCQGLSCFIDQNPLPTFRHSSSLEFVDTTFVEEVA